MRTLTMKVKEEKPVAYVGTLYHVSDDFDVKYVPTLIETKILKAGPKTYRVEARWRTRGAVVLKSSVDSPYGAYSSTPELAWSRHLKILASRQKHASQEVALTGDKIRLALAAIKASGLVGISA